MNWRWLVIIWVIFSQRVFGLWGRDSGRPSTLISTTKRDSSTGTFSPNFGRKPNTQRSDQPMNTWVLITIWVSYLIIPCSPKLNLFAKEALKLHSGRSDCFRDASSVLYSSCESLDFQPSERVKGALNFINSIYQLRSNIRYSRGGHDPVRTGDR